MDFQEQENWRRIKDCLQAIGCTDSKYYQRAVAISDGKPDPLPMGTPPGETSGGN